MFESLRENGIINITSGLQYRARCGFKSTPGPFLQYLRLLRPSNKFWAQTQVSEPNKKRQVSINCEIGSDQF